jgi:GT2 family glycosyltransferase
MLRETRSIRAFRPGVYSRSSRPQALQDMSQLLETPRATAPAREVASFSLDISLVLYNSGRWLPGLIQSLVKQSIDLAAVSLLVHDNASTDNSAEEFERLIAPHRDKFQSVLVLREHRNLGFGKAHNRAIASGTAPFICVVNPDAELHEQCLEFLLARALRDEAAAAWEMRQAPYEHPKIYDPVSLETSWVSAAGVLFRRSAFEEVGGFERGFFMYGEDVDISWRLRERGYVLRYCPGAVLFHHTYMSAGEVKPLQFSGSRKANLYLRARFGTWKDVVDGLWEHLKEVRRWRWQIPGQRMVVLKNLFDALVHLPHWRNGSSRRLKHRFLEWEYEVQRLGAYYDISPALGMRQHPKVSVLIRTIGRKGLLRSALATLQNQTYPNIEVVVVEDGPDTLSEFLGPYRSALNLTYHALGTNKGRCEAGNAAMRLAKGEYLTFLDEDDLLYADHIEQLVSAAVLNDVRIAYSYGFELPSRYSDDGNSIVEVGELFSRYTKPFSFPRLLHHNYIPINAVLFHRSVYEACGDLNPAIPYNEDWNLWVRYALRFRPFLLVPKTTYVYRLPFDNDTPGGRHALLEFHQQRVRELHADIPINTTVAELVEMVQSACGRRDL